MKKLLPIFLLVTSFSFAQNYTIGNWYNFKKGAICLTFDDWDSSHFEIAIPELNKRNIPGTFFINRLSDYSSTISAIEQGHEIANHTESHFHLREIKSWSLRRQISDFKMMLEENTGSLIKTFAYPFGEGGESDSSDYEIQDTVANGHIAARSVSQPLNDSDYSYNFAPNERDYFQIKTVHMKGDMDFYNESFRKVLKYGGMMTYMFHSIDKPGGWDNMESDHFKDVLDDLKLIEDSAWITTFMEAVSYHKEKQSAVLTTLNEPFENDNNWILKLSDTLRDDWYNQELSIKLLKPENITAITGATHGGINLDYSIEKDSIVFNAVPDKGEIIFSVLSCTQPTTNLSITGETKFCIPDSLKMEVDYDENYTYDWFRDSVNLNVDSNVLNIYSSGEYFVTVKLDGCPNSTQKTIVDVTGYCGIPNADFTVNKNKEYIDEKIQFTSTSTNIEGNETYFWDFGEGASLEPGNYGPGPISVSYSTPGKKDVTLKVTGLVSFTDTIKSKIVEITNMDACGIYKEDFNGPDYKFWYGCNCKWGFNYTIDFLNKALRLNLTDSIYGEWDNFVLAFYKDSVMQTLDFSNEFYNPVLRVRAKASDTCRASFTLLDTNYTHTAGMEINRKAYIDLTTEYQEFEIDFSNLFYNQWNKTEVDSTALWGISITINGGFENYSFTNKFGQFINSNFIGNVDVDWISIGDKCYPDSLFANIVTPDTICQGQFFNVWNHSNPELSDAEYIWHFSSLDSSEYTPVSDTVMYSESPISKSFENVGWKQIKLDVVKSNGDTTSVSEYVYIKDCTLSLDEINHNFDLNFNNPFTNSIQGEIMSEVSTKSVLILTDLSGKIIKKKYVFLNQGRNLISIENLNLSDGIYLLNIYGEKSSQNVKLVCKH